MFALSVPPPTVAGTRRKAGAPGSPHLHTGPDIEPLREGSIELPMTGVRVTIPALVVRALALAEARGFRNSSCPETGLLLHGLASTVTTGRIGEIGTGCGVGTAWMLSALQPNVGCVTIDSDPQLVAAVRDVFSNQSAVQVLHGDWRELAGHGPFQLLFADGGHAKMAHPDEVLELVAVGGLLVLDDLTPEEHWPEEWRGKPDPLRTYWLHHERVSSIEVRLAERQAVIIANRLR